MILKIRTKCPECIGPMFGDTDTNSVCCVNSHCSRRGMSRNGTLHEMLSALEDEREEQKAERHSRRRAARGAIGLVVLALLLGCSSPETPHVFHWHGTPPGCADTVQRWTSEHGFNFGGCDK